jgi:hypothetical protein
MKCSADTFCLIEMVLLIIFTDLVVFLLIADQCSFYRVLIPTASTFRAFS